MNLLLLLFPFLTDTAAPVQIVFTSDIHYGITRRSFDGDTNVASAVVNGGLVRKINHLPSLAQPHDHGIAAGTAIGPIDYIMISGDICNRQENGSQSATASWSQFTSGFLHGITLRDHRGRPTPFLMVPGNHDVSDAIGFYRKMTPATDRESLVGIYNYMMHPPTPLTPATYDYAADKINYSRDVGGIHFLFVNIWPDSANRIWMEDDLARIPTSIPVVIVCHDPPEGDAAHFRNPDGNPSPNPVDRFECLLDETCKDTQDPAAKGEGKPQNDRIEQLGLVRFLKKHPNIRAWFHGHNNWNEFYTYTGPDNDIHLATFRVDSPMKGKYSSADETKLSFQLITIDAAGRRFTVREVFWNPDPLDPGAAPVWGQSITMAL
jgi:hypothetical protein